MQDTARRKGAVFVQGEEVSVFGEAFVCVASNLSFGEAIERAKRGRHISRFAWCEEHEGMVALARFQEVLTGHVNAARRQVSRKMLCVQTFGVPPEWLPSLPSQDDLLAYDWAAFEPKKDVEARGELEPTV